MAKESINASDLELILDMVAPDGYNLNIIDPNNRLVGSLDKSCIEKKYQNIIYDILIDLSDGMGVELGKYDFVISFRGLKDKKNNNKAYSYINNPDGTMRWIFPCNLPSPTFLNFYRLTGAKSKLFAYLIKAAYFFKFQKYVASGKFNISYNLPMKMQSIMEEMPHENYSVFTGTVGPNRKILIELNTRKKTTHFIKWGLTEASKKLLKTEHSRILSLSAMGLKNSYLPLICKVVPESHTIYESLKPVKILSISTLGEVHFKSLAEIYEKTISYNVSEICGYKQNVMNRLYRLSPDERIPMSGAMIHMLYKITDVLDNNLRIPFSVAHFDFTPWNMYNDGKLLYIYDWELSDRYAPVLFDLYHYIFQKCILIDHSGLAAIKNEISDALENPIIKDIVNRYNIDTKACYKTYLLYTISYYLDTYSKQPALHTQVSWLANVWYEALVETSTENSNLSRRKSSIPLLLGFLANHGYSLMKFSERKIAEIEEGSDLDILINKRDFPTTLKFIKKLPGIVRIKKVNKSFISTISLFFNDGSFLSIDFLFGFKRKWDLLLSAPEVINTSGTTDEGIKVPQWHHDFEYMMLFYQLNNSDIPAKYKEVFESLSSEVQNSVIEYLNNVYALGNLSEEQLFNFSEATKEKIHKAVLLKKENNGWGRLVSKALYVKDTLTDLISNTGTVITISGVDGAGKSTIIEDLKKTFSKKYRKKVVVLRHRPSLLPILSAWKYGKEKAEMMAAERLPRQGTNNSVVSSAVRFAYYYLDYVIGQFYVYFKYVLRGHTVIYDRYYFDFIGDSKRSNLNINKNVIKWLYRFIYKPKINILLYASPETIIKRKQELSRNDILLLTESYLTLFHSLSTKGGNAKYLAIENIDKQTTIDKILKEYMRVA